MAANIAYPDRRPIDGINLPPLLDGHMKERPRPIGFMEWRNRGALAKRFANKTLKDIDFGAETEGGWVEGKCMLVVNQPDGGPSGWGWTRQAARKPALAQRAA